MLAITFVTPTLLVLRAVRRDSSSVPRADSRQRPPINLHTHSAWLRSPSAQSRTIPHGFPRLLPSPSGAWTHPCCTIRTSNKSLHHDRHAATGSEARAGSDGGDGRRATRKGRRTGPDWQRGEGISNQGEERDRSGEDDVRGAASRATVRSGIVSPRKVRGAAAPTGGAGASINQRSSPNRSRFGSVAKAVRKFARPAPAKAVQFASLAK
jgi:hypothetical protein